MTPGRPVLFKLCITACLMFLPAVSWAAPLSPPGRWLGFEQRGDSFIARGSNYSVLVERSRAVLALPHSAVTLQALGGTGDWTLTGMEQRPGVVHYMNGANPAESYRLYSQVKAVNVYPGIDLIVRGNNEHFEYDFEVRAGNDAGAIAIAFQGITGIAIDDHGDLILHAADGEIRQPKPHAWQIVNGEKHLVDISYRLSRGGSVRFQLGTHESGADLTIDPEVVFQNNVGGSTPGFGESIALDPAGNIYVAGYTRAFDFPVVNPLQAHNGTQSSTAFVQKWSADGSTLIYSTYLGGSTYDAAYGLAVDSAGDAYVGGVTGSADFPVTANAFQKQLAGNINAFVAKIAPDGSRLIYSTFLGGGTENLTAIAVDSSGNAVVTGETSSPAFPLTPGAYQTSLSTSCNFSQLVDVGVPSNGDAFVTRLAADSSSLAYSTLLGGVCGTIGQSLAIDPAGNVWVAGKTSSSDFPIAGNALQPNFGNGIVDGFLARFTPQGALIYSSYLGAGYTSIGGVALDNQGNLFVAGVTSGLSQPVSPNAVQTSTALSCFELGFGPVGIVDNGVGFAAKLDPSAASLLALTYLGGGCFQNVTVAVDSQGTPWVGGNTAGNTYYPTVDPLAIWTGGGFLSKLNPDLTQLPFSTFFSPINGLALDSGGFAYVTGADAVSKVDPAPTAVSLDSLSYTGIRPGNQNGFVIAPGQVVRLFGKNLGPSPPVPGIVAGGSVLNEVAGVQVSFGGYAAPVLVAGAGEIDTVVPFEVAGQTSTPVQVTYNGVHSNSVQVGLAPDALEVLGVFNGDFTINSPSNPAQAGSVMSIYVSGLGSILPGAVDGEVNQPPYADLRGRFLLNGYFAGTPNAQTLTLTAAEPAPGAVAGVIQVNFVVPPGMTSVIIRADSGLGTFTTSVQ